MSQIFTISLASTFVLNCIWQADSRHRFLIPTSTMTMAIKKSLPCNTRSMLANDITITYYIITFSNQWTVYEKKSTWQRGQEAWDYVWKYHLKIFRRGSDKNSNSACAMVSIILSFHNLRFTCYCYFEIWEYLLRFLAIKIRGEQSWTLTWGITTFIQI